jgi:hypothetical protein
MHQIVGDADGAELGDLLGTSLGAVLGYNDGRGEIVGGAEGAPLTVG